MKTDTPDIHRSRSPARAGWRVPVAFLLALALPACGNLTAGGYTPGEASVAVSGDAPDSGAAATVPAPSFAVMPSLLEGGEAEGEIDAEFRLFLDGDSGSVALSDHDIRVRVDVEGTREADAVTATIPTGTYTQLRIVFSEIDVEIESGLIIDGVPVLGDLRVELEDGTLTVTRPLQIEVEEGGRLDLLVDLNADDWLSAADPVLGVVAETIFAQAVEVEVR